MAEVPFSEGDYRDLLSFRSQFTTPTDAARKVADLERDNQKQRDEINGLKEKAKAVPPEGAVVLMGDAAKRHAAFQALGVEPADVAKLKTERDALAEKDATRTRKDAFSAAVKALKWPEDTVETLLDMRSLDGATVEVKTEKSRDAAGKEVDVLVPYVTLAGEGKTAQKFAEFAGTAPQLKGIRTTAGEANGTATTGVSVEEHRGAGGGTAAAVTGGIDDMIAANQAAAKAGNAMVPKKAAA